MAVAVGPAVVAWADPDGEGTHPAGTAGLSEPDRVRGDGFGPRRRSEFVLGRALLAGLVGVLSPGATGWWLENAVCGRCGARHGRVEVIGAPVRASVAYAAGLVVAAAAPAGQVERLGIDVEVEALADSRRSDLVRLLGGADGQVVRRWTRIEALLKADGRGLRLDPETVRLRPGSGRIEGEPTRYRLADVPAPSGHLITLAWCGAAAWAGPAGRASR